MLPLAGLELMKMIHAAQILTCFRGSANALPADGDAKGYPGRGYERVCLIRVAVKPHDIRFVLGPLTKMRGNGDAATH